jgi:hypothetical protein
MRASKAGRYRDSLYLRASGGDLYALGISMKKPHLKGYSNKTQWQGMAPVFPKGQPMPQTREYWIQLAARDQELILEQSAEIARLKQTINKLRQRNGQLKA